MDRTATLKIASLPLSLFAENNSGATPPVTEQKYERAIATATFGELLKFVLFCRSRVYFSVSPSSVFQAINFVGCPFFEQP